jgi:hypothetical protein
VTGRRRPSAQTTSAGAGPCGIVGDDERNHGRSEPASPRSAPACATLHDALNKSTAALRSETSRQRASTPGRAAAQSATRTAGRRLRGAIHSRLTLFHHRTIAACLMQPAAVWLRRMARIDSVAGRCSTPVGMTARHEPFRRHPVIQRLGSFGCSETVPSPLRAADFAAIQGIVPEARVI